MELQCWGYTLGQTANLALMLGQANCTCFEQPTPYEADECGAETVLRTGAGGWVHTPVGFGLGIKTDWAALQDAALGGWSLRKAYATKGVTAAAET